MRLLVLLTAAILLTFYYECCHALNLQIIHNKFDYPNAIELRAGVVHAPPFAVVSQQDDGTNNFSGFQIDLLERLKEFAYQDGVDLQVDLHPAPDTYLGALNLVSSDCNTTDNPYPLEDCQRFDFIVGDYYTNADRHMIVDLSPSWLKTSITTIKETGQSVTTLREAEETGATVCVPDGTYSMEVVMDKFPEANYLKCAMFSKEEDCLSNLRNGTCALLADDELLLHWKARDDPKLEVTGETMNTQFIVWPFREDLEPVTSKLLKKWLYRAVQNAVLDDLFFKYFKKELCPLGTAGEQCELPCHAEYGRADSTGKCVCKSTRWGGDDCSEERQEDPNLLSTGIISFGYSLVGLTFFFVFLCACWLYRNRNRSQVQFAQPLLLVMILLGCFISTSTIIALAQQDSGDGLVPACVALPWLYSVGFSITLGALYTRVWRVYRVMESAVEMRRVTVTAQQTVTTVAAVLAVDVVILTIWSAVDTPYWSRETTLTDLFGYPLESEGYCTSDHFFIFAGIISGYHGIVMLSACYMCYKARHIPDDLGGTKFCAIAIFSNMQIFLVGVPMLLMVYMKSTEYSFTVATLIIWINDFGVLLLVFGSLFYSIRKFDQKKTRNSMMKSDAMLGQTLKDYAQKRGSDSTRSLFVDGPPLVGELSNPFAMLHDLSSNPMAKLQLCSSPFVKRFSHATRNRQDESDITHEMGSSTLSGLETICGIPMTAFGSGKFSTYSSEDELDTNTCNREKVVSTSAESTHKPNDVAQQPASVSVPTMLGGDESDEEEQSHDAGAQPPPSFQGHLLPTPDSIICNAEKDVSNKCTLQQSTFDQLHPPASALTVTDKHEVAQPTSSVAVPTMLGRCRRNDKEWAAEEFILAQTLKLSIEGSQNAPVPEESKPSTQGERNSQRPNDSIPLRESLPPLQWTRKAGGLLDTFQQEGCSSYQMHGKKQGQTKTMQNPGQYPLPFPTREKNVQMSNDYKDEDDDITWDV